MATDVKVPASPDDLLAEIRDRAQRAANGIRDLDDSSRWRPCRDLRQSDLVSCLSWLI